MKFGVFLYIENLIVKYKLYKNVYMINVICGYVLFWFMYDLVVLCIDRNSINFGVGGIMFLGLFVKFKFIFVFVCWKYCFRFFIVK